MFYAEQFLLPILLGCEKLKDFYEILGISKDASLETIEAAYNTLSDRFLTNVSIDNILDAEAEKEKIKEAYAVLSDSAARQKYDLELSADSAINDEPAPQDTGATADTVVAVDAVAAADAAAAAEAEDDLRRERAKALLNQKIYNDNFEQEEPVIKPQKSKRNLFLLLGGIVVIVLALIFLASLFHNDSNNLGIDTGTNATTAQQTSATTAGSTSSQNSTTTKSGGTTTSPVNESTMPSGSQVEVTTGTDGMPVNSNLERVMGSILKSSTYTMKFEINTTDQKGNAETLPITAAVSGKKTSLETKIEMTAGGADISIRMLSTGTDFYAIIPSMKAYMKLPAAEFKGLFPDVLNSNKTTIKYVGTTNVNYKGIKYICETYKGDGTVTKYYFNGGNLKRIEIIEKDGSSSILENVSFSATVDESVFTLPTGYIDMSGLAGGLGSLGN